MSENKISDSLFAITRDNIPSATELALDALKNSEFEVMSLAELKSSFSRAVSQLQVDAYNRYLDSEKESAQMAIKRVFRSIVSDADSVDQALSLFAEQFGALDSFSLSLTQSRRARAGTAFEVIVSSLFSRLSYPYTPQPNIGGSTPDYVLPSIDWYLQYPADSIIFTLKRTLRERWRQIVTESSSGKYYLATIDEKVSASGLDQMMQRNITLVVPIEVKEKKYLKNLNVISFEDFFEDHLDPSMNRWRKADAI